jgi:hypothetical protein
VFAALAPVSFVAVPFAALLVAAGPASGRERIAAGLAGALAAVLLLAPERGLIDGVTRAWIVLVTVAFVTIARLRVAGFWSLALRACLYAGVGMAIVAPVAAGSMVWQQVQWEATRDASRSMRYAVEVAPRLYPAFEPVVRIIAVSWPVWLVLATLAGLALAWRGQAVVHGTVVNR